MALERYKRTARVDTGSPDMTAAAGISRRAGAFDRFADTMHDTRDREVAARQETAGKTAGAQDPYTPNREPGTIAADAYNRGLAVTRAAGLANDAKESLQRFHMEHPDDIEGFQSKVAGYRKGVASQLDKDQAALFDLELDHLATPMVIDIERTVRKQTIDRGRAESAQFFENAAEEAARAARSGDAAGATDGLGRLGVAVAAALSADLISEPEAMKVAKTAQEAIDREIVLGAFERTLQSEGLNAADARLQAFKNSRPDELSPDEHRKLTSEMRALWAQEASRQTRLKSLGDAQNKALEKQLNESVKDAKFVLSRGKIPPYINELVSLTAGTDRGDDLEEALVMAHKVQAFGTQTPEARAQILAEVDREEVMSRQDIETLEAMEKRDAELTALAKENAMAYGVEVGIVGDQPPLDLANPGPALIARKEGAQAVEERLGRRVSPLMPVDEMMIARQLNGVTPDEHAQVLGALVRDLGPRYAVQAMDGMEKDGRQYAAAGIAIAEGDPVAAQTILDGLALRRNKDMPNIVPKDGDLVNELGDLYALYQNDPAKRAQMTDAVKSAYASLSAQEGDFTGIISSNRVEAAVNLVTGGVIKTDWGMISAPRRGLDEDDFDRWIDRLTVDDLESMGGVTHLGNAAALEALKDEDVTLEEISRGRYRVRTPINYYWARPDGKPFVLEFNR